MNEMHFEVETIAIKYIFEYVQNSSIFEKIKNYY